MEAAVLSLLMGGIILYNATPSSLFLFEVLLKKKPGLYWYLFILANLLPLIGFFAGWWSLNHAMYVYWGECALAALLALVMYARYLIVFFLMTAAIGLIVYVANPQLLGNPAPVGLFWSLYSLCWLAYIEIGKSAYGQRLKRRRPAEQLGIYFVFMAVAMGLCFFLTDITIDIGQHQDPAFYKTVISAAIVVPAISIGILRVVDMIGQKHFMDFLFGTYHQPQEKNSIVLFLDMVGSSTVAEKLEPRKSMDLIAEFIYDCSYIFRIHGGDILNYTGDGLVVLWPRHQSNHALAAVHKLRNHFGSKSVRTHYWKKFGILPDFRIGLHAGPVVISQIGEEKLFLGLYGDVVNTAARLEQMNKEFGTHILLSSEVIQGLNQSWKTLLKPLGEQAVRGRDEKIQVFALYGEVHG